MKHLIKLLNASLKRIEEGDLETAKLAIKQVLSDLQNMKSDSTPIPVSAHPYKKEELIKDGEKESFKDYFIKLIKDCVITERDEEITDEGEEPYIVKEYSKDGKLFMEYLIDEKKFYINQQSMGISSTYLNEKTDIELYGGTKKFHIIVQGILRDYYKVPVEEIQIFNS